MVWWGLWLHRPYLFVSEMTKGECGFWMPVPTIVVAIISVAQIKPTTGKCAAPWPVRQGLRPWRSSAPGPAAPPP